MIVDKPIRFQSEEHIKGRIGDFRHFAAYLSVAPAPLVRINPYADDQLGDRALWIPVKLTGRCGPTSPRTHLVVEIEIDDAKWWVDARCLAWDTDGTPIAWKCYEWTQQVHE